MSAKKNNPPSSLAPEKIAKLLREKLTLHEIGPEHENFDRFQNLEKILENLQALSQARSLNKGGMSPEEIVNLAIALQIHPPQHPHREAFDLQMPMEDRRKGDALSDLYEEYQTRRQNLSKTKPKNNGEKPAAPREPVNNAPNIRSVRVSFPSTGSLAMD